LTEVISKSDSDIEESFRFNLGTYVLMRYLYKFLLILFISFLSINFSNSKETAFVDIDFIIANSDIGKKVLSSIDKLNKENLENLKKKNKSLQELEITIKNKKNVISDDAFKKEVVSFQKKVQKFKEDKNIMVKKFNDFKRKELENVFKTNKSNN
jgi:outer membrane protein